MKIEFTLPDITNLKVDLDAKEVEELIKKSITKDVNYAIMTQIDKEVQVWVAEILREQKTAMMEKLRPQIEKQVGELKVSRY